MTEEFKFPKKKRNHIDKDELIKLIDKHHIDDVADRFGVHKLTIHCRLKDFGLKYEDFKKMPFSKDNEEYIKKNCKTLTINQMSKERGLRWNHIFNFMRENGLVFKSTKNRGLLSEHKQSRIDKIESLRSNHKHISSNEACKIIYCIPAQGDLADIYDRCEVFKARDLIIYKAILIDLNKRNYKKNLNISPNSLIITSLFLGSDVMITKMTEIIHDDNRNRAINIRSTLRLLFPDTFNKLKGIEWTSPLREKYQKANKLG